MNDSRRGFLAILLGRIGLTLGYVYMAMGIMIGLFPIFTHFHAFSRIFTPCSRIIAEAWHELSGPKADHLPRQAREERFYAKNKEQIEQQLLCFLLCLFGCLQGVRLSRFHARCCSRRRTARPARLARCESYQPRPALSARFRVVFVSRACLGNS